MRSTFEIDFDRAMANLNMKCPKGFKDFMRLALSNLVGLSSRQISTLDVVDNNFSQTFNVYIWLSREKATIEMFEGIITMLMERIAEEVGISHKLIVHMLI